MGPMTALVLTAAAPAATYLAVPAKSDLPTMPKANKVVAGTAVAAGGLFIGALAAGLFGSRAGAGAVIGSLLGGGVALYLFSKDVG